MIEISSSPLNVSDCYLMMATIAGWNMKLLSLTPSWLIYTISCVLTAISLYFMIFVTHKGDVSPQRVWWCTNLPTSDRQNFISCWCLKM